ncbi:unnamed protein product [Pleuronectes platessa]|uniref:Uncharacterized protein n=1 Tax=Pleuronectes platessa TaxID=8262 RepID=A0A9N7Y654_PLEPL|nr:unnamed protein product [Pleuronectes platessa]
MLVPEQNRDMSRGSAAQTENRIQTEASGGNDRKSRRRLFDAGSGDYTAALPQEKTRIRSITHRLLLLLGAGGEAPRPGTHPELLPVPQTTGDHGKRRRNVSGPTGVCRTLQECVGPYRSVLAPTGVCWPLKECVGPYRSVLAPTGVCRTLQECVGPLQECVGPYRNVSDPTGVCWPLQECVGPYRSVLAPEGVCRTLQECVGP